VVACPSCGFSNLPEARFCSGCGASLAEGPVAREVRKTVTIVFCDVTGSTALGERLDPESLRQVMARYFEAMRAVIERHGGTVEKFIGDAVMAVFGVPVVHEDDALRAVRAAAEMREALAALNAELERDYATTLEARIGINTGGVVTGTEERLATGDAVNLAARLEQAAPPGEILLGAETAGLVRGAVTLEALAPLAVKGKSEGVAAHRLLSVDAAEIPRRADTPFVGRSRELQLLSNAWERAASERACALFTVLGPAGVGKSRLAAEFIAAADASVVTGRCLSYGEGITYWPVVEVFLQLRGAELPGLVGDRVVTSPEEIALGFRRLLEAAAAERPLVVLFDDVQWGEPAFLELIEHVAAMSRSAPILLLCLARPELLDRRPGWGGGLLNATTVLLEPLSTDETDELIVSLGRVDSDLAARIRAAAEGNPLFVQEMLAMVADGGGGDVVVPPTVQALLAARLDQLEGDERRVLECGSVEGQLFHRGSVEALGAAANQLSDLVRKELVRPDASLFSGDDAYRFRHILLRDAAYEALPKSTRADLHEQFADCLDGRTEKLVEHDEILGHHLEQAYLYRSELGPVDHVGRKLASRASGRLVAGARLARLRGDHRAASGLLARAAALLPDNEPSRLELELDLVRVCFDAGDFPRAESSIAHVMRAGKELADERLVARAQLESLTLWSMVAGAEAGIHLEEFRETVAVLEGLGDEVGLAQGLFYLARAHFFDGQCAIGDGAFERAIDLADRQGLDRESYDWREWQATLRRYGPMPVDEAIATMDEVIAWGSDRGVRALGAELQKASLLAMRGDSAEARALVRRVAPIASELGIQDVAALASQGGYVELISGDADAAVDHLSVAWKRFGEIGETGFRSSMGTHLAEALAAAGRHTEAEAVLTEVEQFVARDDFDPQVRLRTVRARILAHRGALLEAEANARDAVSRVDATDYIDLRGDAHATLGDVLASAGRRSEAAEEWQTAVALYEAKGNTVMASRLRERNAS
jgi:class 3 adenylate cyclase/tetratricopeptide (TPR) repeat protein